MNDQLESPKPDDMRNVYDVVFPDYDQMPRRNASSNLKWSEMMAAFAPFVAAYMEKRRRDPDFYREKYRIRATERFEL
ncbi:MAG: hypothetical protein O3C21_12975 [Verrucomicrobia bacterium]|nr:hypothetical protein [Verrucomicrobiota bacterium]